MDKFESTGSVFKQIYREIVQQRYPTMVDHWPVISGSNETTGRFGEWAIIFLKHTGIKLSTFVNDGDISPSLIGASSIEPHSIEDIRQRLVEHYGATDKDLVLLIKADPPVLMNEVQYALLKHETALNLIPMKIFLSHKSIDKPKVREIKEILEILGFDPWLDEDMLAAGIELERGLLQGFKDSCAAIFFITKNFTDEKYLSTEINYAIAEKRKKGKAFAIITLALKDDEQGVVIPELLEPYVWKEPHNLLQALKEIIKALPVKVGKPYMK